MIPPILGSLIIGLILGFLGQRSRMCFIGGFRDFLIIRDKDLLKGLLSFITSAWITVFILNFIGKVIPFLTNITNVRLVSYPSFINAITSKFGLVSLIGGFGLGFFSTLANGCPFRQHVMASQGRISSISYLFGFYSGIVFYYTVIAKLLAKII